MFGTIKTLKHKVNKINRIVLRRQLILDNDVDRRMERDIGQIDSSLPVILLDNTEPFLFIEFDPLGRIGCLRWLVAVHAGLGCEG